MPGEDELPLGAPPVESAAAAARLDVVAARMETLGAVLQRGVSDATESMATLSRSVGTVSSDLARLVQEAMDALGRTGRIVNNTDHAIAALVTSFGHVEDRLAALAGDLADVVERQHQLESDRPDPEAISAAVGAAVASAVAGVVERFEEQVSAFAAEMRDERTVQARRLRELARPAGQLTAEAVRDEVQAVVEAVTSGAIDQLRADVERLVGEVHDDRTLLFKRLAGSRELAEVKDAMTALVTRGDIVDLQTALEDELAAQAERLGEARTALVEASERDRDGDALERVRTDIQALAEDLTTTAKRALAGQRLMEELRDQVAQELPAGLREAVAGATAELRGETESLVTELHDDLALVMRQVVAGNDELEQIRAAVEGLQADAVDENASPAGPDDEERSAVATLRDDMIGALTELHGDIALVLTRLATGQRDLDDVRQAVVDAVEAGAAPLDERALAARLSGELVAPLAELGDDLSVLVRSTSATQDDLEQLRTDVAALTAALTPSEPDEESAEELEVPEPEGPDLFDLLEALRGDVEAGIGAVATDLKDELDSLRQLLSSAPAVDQGSVGAEVEAVMADVRDDLALLAQHVLNAQEEVAGLRAEVAEAARPEPSATPGPELLDATEEVRAAVDALSEELRAQFDRLRQVLGRPRPEPAPPDIEGAVADLHEDLSVVLGQIVAGQEDLRAIRDEVTAGRDEVGVVPGELAAIRDELGALLEVVGQVPQAPAPIDADHLEVAIADLPAVLAAEIRSEFEEVAAELRAGIDHLRTLLDGAGMPVSAVDTTELRDELQVLVNELHDDLGTLMSQVVSGQDELSLLRIELADALTSPARAEDPSLAIEDMHADVTAGLADLGIDLRATIEALVGDLHDDLAGLMSQIVAGQDDLDALRQSLAETDRRGPADQVASDLDRLTRDLQAVRDRLPAPAGTPAARRRRPQPNR